MPESASVGRRKPSQLRTIAIQRFVTCLHENEEEQQEDPSDDANKRAALLKQWPDMRRILEEIKVRAQDPIFRNLDALENDFISKLDVAPKRAPAHWKFWCLRNRKDMESWTEAKDINELHPYPVDSRNDRANEAVRFKQRLRLAKETVCRYLLKEIPQSTRKAATKSASVRSDEDIEVVRVNIDAWRDCWRQKETLQTVAQLDVTFCGSWLPPACETEVTFSFFYHLAVMPTDEPLPTKGFPEKVDLSWVTDSTIVPEEGSTQLGTRFSRPTKPITLTMDSSAMTFGELLNQRSLTGGTSMSGSRDAKTSIPPSIGPSIVPRGQKSTSRGGKHKVGSSRTARSRTGGRAGSSRRSVRGTGTQTSQASLKRGA